MISGALDFGQLSSGTYVHLIKIKTACCNWVLLFLAVFSWGHRASDTSSSVTAVDFVEFASY